MTGVFTQRDGTCTSAATDKPAPCCYTDANGSSCHCQRARVAEAALATAHADALREAANKSVIAAAIYDPGATQGYKGDRTLTEWQADAVVYTILDLIPQEKPHE